MIRYREAGRLVHAQASSCDNFHMAGTAPHRVLLQQLELRSEPPAEAPSTRLSARKPVFWELEVHLDLPGLDFNEICLVPVYAGP